MKFFGESHELGWGCMHASALSSKNAARAPTGIGARDSETLLQKSQEQIKISESLHLAPDDFKAVELGVPQIEN